MLPEDQLAQTPFGLLDLLVFVRQSNLSCKVQRIMRGLHNLMAIDKLLDSLTSVGQLVL